MDHMKLNTYNNQPENLPLSSKIVSPAPIRKTSKISFNIARELFDLPSSVEESDSNNINFMASPFFQAKFYNLRNDVESPNEWSMESSSSDSIQGDFESPVKPATRSYLVIDDNEDNSMEIVPRATNPIVHDIHFMRCNQEPLKLNFASTLVVRP